MNAITFREWLIIATQQLAEVSESPRLDAELLLAAALGRTRSTLHAWPERMLEPEPAACFTAWLERRCSGEPVAYILGHREFWSLELQVTPDTLIPRPETELLVELALERLPANRPVTVADLGTGSGAIALALAVERPQARIVATEGKQSALAQAVGQDWKGKASLTCYLVAIGTALFWPWLAHILYVVVALLWLIPDRRIERVLRAPDREAP